jgi:uncharacterized LabA/DUF88 family protein
MAIRAFYLVDGFNLYHSLKEVGRITQASVKWLDLRAVCQGSLHAVRKALGDRIELADVHWFSARPDHLIHGKPAAVTRYDIYADALRHSGVQVHLSQFKRKDIRCKECKKTFYRHEEKETDVALAVKIVNAVVREECEIVVLVTGDTDLIPAI